MNELIIGNLGSYTDFNLMIATRSISLPKKKEIKVSVPFQNGAYDFSKINGELAWEERELTYTFDFADFDISNLEREKSMFLNWIMNVFNEDIYDPYYKDYHFHGSFKEVKQSDNFQSATLEVVFSVYPYLIKNNPTVYEFNLTSDEEVLINTNSAHRIVPTIQSDNELTIIANGSTYKLGAGEFKDSKLYLDNTKWLLKGKGKVKITVIEEIF